MDRIDARILEELQRDSARGIAAVAQKAGVSTSACHRRIKAMEADGTILGYGARIDPAKLGLALHAVVEITLTSQSKEAMDRFEEAVRGFDEILDCRLMSGEADYLLRIAARDIGEYDRIHRSCLSRLPGVSAMHSSFVIRAIKDWSGFHLR